MEKIVLEDLQVIEESSDEGTGFGIICFGPGMGTGCGYICGIGCGPAQGNWCF